MNTNPYLNAFYQSYDEDSRLAPRHGSVEFLTTMRYIERYIQPGDRVIEIGAGTGRYSHALARRGYAVQAVELVEHNIEVFAAIRWSRKMYPSCRKCTGPVGVPFRLYESHCFWARSTIFIPRRTSGRLCARPSG